MKSAAFFAYKKIEKRRANNFWKWFEKQNHPFLFLQDMGEEEKEQLMDGLLTQLHKYDRNLFFEIGGREENEKMELIITAEGIVKNFPKVELLVAIAPMFKDWTVLAFRQPSGTDFNLKYQGKEFRPDKIIFIPVCNEDLPDSLGIQVFYPDYTEEEREIFMFGTYIMIDSLIGEKSATLDIEYLEVSATPDDISEYDFMHLSALPDYILAWKGEA